MCVYISAMGEWGKLSHISLKLFSRQEEGRGKTCIAIESSGCLLSKRNLKKAYNIGPYNFSKVKSHNLPLVRGKQCCVIV